MYDLLECDVCKGPPVYNANLVYEKPYGFLCLNCRRKLLAPKMVLIVRPGNGNGKDRYNYYNPVTDEEDYLFKLDTFQSCGWFIREIEKREVKIEAGNQLEIIKLEFLGSQDCFRIRGGDLAKGIPCSRNDSSICINKKRIEYTREWAEIGNDGLILKGGK